MGTSEWFVTCVSWVHLHSMLLLRWISFHNGNSCWKVEIKTIQLFILWKDIRWCSRIDSVWTSSHHDKLFSCFHCKKIFINKQNEGILTSSLVHQVACIWENLVIVIITWVTSAYRMVDIEWYKSSNKNYSAQQLQSWKEVHQSSRNEAAWTNSHQW